MPEILHSLTILAPIDLTFEAVTKPACLDRWWTESSSGTPERGGAYELHFGRGTNWRAVVHTFAPPSSVEFELVEAADDWVGTRVGFHLESSGRATTLRFWHTGWKADTDHFRISSYCWAMYLRLLKRYLEHGETVDYENRADA